MPQHGADIAIGASEGIGDGRDCRAVADRPDEVPTKLGGDMLGRGRMPHHDFEDSVEIRGAEAGRNLCAEDELGTVIMGLGIELHFAFLKVMLVPHRPTGEAPRDFHHIILRVAAMHAERVQFHELPRVILVRLVIRAFTLVHAPIQIPEHGGAQRGGADQVRKFSEGVRPNDIAIIRGLEPAVFAFGRVDIEMVAPKLDHDFEKLALAQHRSKNGGTGQIVQKRFFLEFVELAHAGAAIFERWKKLLDRVFRIATPGEEMGIRLAEFIKFMADDAIALPVVDPLGSELLLDETLRAKCADACMVSRARPKGETVEQMGNRVDLGEEGACERPSRGTAVRLPIHRRSCWPASFFWSHPQPAAAAAPAPSARNWRREIVMGSSRAGALPSLPQAMAQEPRSACRDGHKSQRRQSRR